ncbi:MAG: Na+/H+ antiporter subunit E [Candidatus Marinimicrobia bacterium]|nr:Na+/H+ antiporter subunit E [Candidatus Neomarinimicrobiota bacterium]
MNKLKHSLILFFMLMVIWLLLTSPDLQEIIAGVITSAMIVLLTQKLEPVLGDVRITPQSIISVIRFIFVFLRELIVSNLDVAKRVLSPSLPINPGFVIVNTRLKSNIGKLVLANSITLTPGTLTTEVKGQNLYIHWIDIKEDDMEGATKEIVQKFEKHLEVIFG